MQPAEELAEFPYKPGPPPGLTGEPCGTRLQLCFLGSSGGHFPGPKEEKVYSLYHI